MRSGWGYRAGLWGLLCAATTLGIGCGAPAGPSAGRPISDEEAFRQLLALRIEKTTLNSVGETYSRRAWFEIQKPSSSPYRPLTEGQVFDWPLLDELDRRQATAEQPAGRKGARGSVPAEKRTVEGAEKPSAPTKKKVSTPAPAQPQPVKEAAEEPKGTPQEEKETPETKKAPEVEEKSVEKGTTESPAPSKRRGRAR